MSLLGPPGAPLGPSGPAATAARGVIPQVPFRTLGRPTHGPALPTSTLAAYAAGDMDRARLDVWAPDAGLIDTCTAPSEPVRGTCVLQKTES